MITLFYLEKRLKGKKIIDMLIFWYRKGKLYLVFEFVEKTLLEILESRTNGIGQDLV
jgi:cyclin-dependent kinase-like